MQASPDDPGTRGLGSAKTKRSKKAKGSKRKMSEQESAEERGRKLLEQLRAEASSEGDTLPKRGSYRDGPFEEPIAPDEGVMPEVVSNRIVRRVVTFAGLPIFLAVVSFVAFYYATTQLDMDILPQVVAYITQALLLLSFAGITYGVLSTSWDEDEEGTLLGWENVGPNVAAMRGQEASRISQAKLEIEEQEAAEAGISIGRRTAQRSRDQQE